MTNSLVNKNQTVQKHVTGSVVSARDSFVTQVASPHVNFGLQRIVSACLAEIANGIIADTFLQQLQHYNRPPSERNLETKLIGSGQNSAYYEFAIAAKEDFAKFVEVIGRTPSGQLVLVSAFKHAYSIYGEKIKPKIGQLTFSQQESIFDELIVEYLSQNLTGLPNFYGRNEAIGLLFYLADNCFIEYAKC